MSWFGATRAALAQGQHVVCPRFVTFDVNLGSAGPIRVWEGVGPIVIDGETFDGLGELGSVSESEFGLDDAAGNVVYTLSGVSPDIVSLAQAGYAEVRGRAVTLQGRFLSADTFAPLDSTFTLRSDIADAISFSGVGPSDRRITVTAETIWTNRNAASFAYYSDRDQQARFPGDLGLSYISELGNKRIDWPVFP